ncbi:DsbA family protein [Robiginitomaculum antarcticum]|uniref:DsbA family protein n=1 Tax=Robiginitomaculum antarcticum TaxID=437507 RepID=UPI000377499C|nr:DsbA family protein [Robiginitomaculum antarcticum]
MAALKSYIIRYLLSEGRMLRKRVFYESKMTSREIVFFHDPKDAHSVLLASQIPALLDWYGLTLRAFTITDMPPKYAPELDALRAWAKEDARWLSARLGIKFPGHVPGEIADAPEGTAQLLKLGHYQGGMIYYAGEWYWGLDRLHFLEERLQDIGRGEGAPITPPVDWDRNDTRKTDRSIKAFLSLRSPYSYLAAMKIYDLARQHEATVSLRPVLPMLMRGYDVPKSKRLYIAGDVARQARRKNIPYGLISDAVGKPTERGMAVLFSVLGTPREEAFLKSFYKAVWAEGVNAGSAIGLRRICERAGITRDEVGAALRDETWRAKAAKNQADLHAAGLWGVPSFIVNGQAVWGEDRLARIQENLFQN